MRFPRSSAQRVAVSVLLAVATEAACADVAWLRHVVVCDPATVRLHATSDGEIAELADGVLPEDEPGAPWLPVRYLQLALPHGARVVELQTELYECELQRNVDLAPCQPQYPLSSAERPRVPRDAAAYARPGRQPAVVAQCTGVHNARRFALAGLRVQPVRYDAAARVLYCATQIVVRVGFTRSPTPQARAAQPTTLDNMLRELAAASYELPVTLAPRAAATAQTDYLIITSSALTGAFQQLAQYRSVNDGFSVKLLAVEQITNTFAGEDAPAKIRACIRHYVDTEALQYVVLGGDDTIVPVRKCSVAIRTSISTTMPTDLYYSGLDGTWDDWNMNGIYGEADVGGHNDHDEGDLIPDVVVGRLPVRTAAEAQAYITKLIACERGAWADTTAARALLGGVMLWDTYSGADRPGDALNDGLAPFTSHAPVSDAEMWQRRLYRDGIQRFWQPTVFALFCDTLTSWDDGTAGAYALSRANFSTCWNAGWNCVSFGTHGSAASWALEGDSFSPADALALTNTARIVYTVACDSAAFDGSYDPCLSEAFLRNANGGVLAYIGCSRYGWGGPDDPPASPYSDGGTSSAYEYEFWRQVHARRPARLGDAFALHKAAKAPACGANYAYRWVQFGLNLQGDPALRLRWDSGAYAATAVVTNDSNDNTFWEPGETADLLVQVGNQTADALTTTVRLEAVDSALIPAAPALQIAPSLAAYTSTTLLFSAEAAANCPAGQHALRARVSSSAGERSNIFWFTVQPVPCAAIAPTTQPVWVDSTQTSTCSVVIHNTGSAPLSYQITGGDNYVWQTSDMTNGPVVAWRDITASGTLVPLGDDDVSAACALGHEFFFYGLHCTNVIIGSNGGVGFRPGYLDGNNQPLPCLAHNAFGALAAVFWDDLNPDLSQPGGAGAIRIHTNAEETVIAWLGVPRLEYASQTMTFQLVMRRTGELLMQYQSMNGVVNEATVGVQADNLPARAAQAAYNQPFITNNFAVRFTPPALPGWLLCAQPQGVLVPGAARTAQFVVIGAAVPPGVTDTTVYVWHNHHDAPNVTPVTIAVIPEPCMWLVWAAIGVLCRLQSTFFVE